MKVLYCVVWNCRSFSVQPVQRYISLREFDIFVYGFDSEIIASKNIFDVL